MNTGQLTKITTVSIVLLGNLFTAGFALSFIQQGTSLATPQSGNFVVSSIYDDEFNGPNINPSWYWYNENPLNWSLSKSPGNLQITSTEGDWVDACEPDVENLLLLQPNLPDYVLTTKLDFNPTANFQQAGLIAFEDNYTRVKLSAAYNNEQFSGQIIEFVMVLDGVRTNRYHVAADLTQPIYLKLEKSGNIYTGYYSYDNNTFSAFPQVTAPEFSEYNVGVYANNSCYYNVPDIPANFDYIHVSVPCDAPFFWQRDPNGINDHPLLSHLGPNNCGTDYDTLGEGGCTLTAATMLFRHYGADTTANNTEMTPPNLSDCMNKNACPFNWLTGSACTNEKASNPRRDYSFSYAQLEKELNENNRPVILQMCMPKGNCNWEGPITHWVLVVGGQGTEPANYTIWDPWFKCGENMRLNSRSEKWDFVGMAVYDGTPTCGFSTEVPSCALSISPVGLPSGANAIIAEENRATSVAPPASSNISGTVILYRATNVTMTVQLSAQSSGGNISDMLIWSDTISNTTWQPFAPYVWLPLSNFVYAQFRDDQGNISAILSDTPNPSAPPAGLNPHRVYLPLATRQ